MFPQRTPAIIVAKMPNGQHIAISANKESVEMMQCTSDAPTMVCEVSEDDVEFADDSNVMMRNTLWIRYHSFVPI